MKENINLGAETVEFVRRRSSEILENNPQNIEKIEFNMKEVKEQIFRLFYEYQVDRGWPHVAANMEKILGIERSTTYKIVKKKP